MAGHDDEKKRETVTLVNSPGGFWTLSTPAKVSKRDLDEAAEDLLRDVDIPLFTRSGS